MAPNIKSVKPLEAFQVLVTYQNGEKRIFDFTPYLTVGKYQELKIPEIFNSVHVSFDTIAWSNELDIDPDFLYKKSKPVDLSKSKKDPKKVKILRK